jgi:hypothetical protein
LLAVVVALFGEFFIRGKLGMAVAFIAVPCYVAVTLTPDHSAAAALVQSSVSLSAMEEAANNLAHALGYVSSSSR